MVTSRARLVGNNQVVYDQADFFAGDAFTRVTGLNITNVSVTLFYQNIPQPWILVDGSGVTDGQVAAGKIYWNEIPGAAGYYNVRFRPNAIGYWRLNLIYTTGMQLVLHDFDVVPDVTVGGSGMSSSFNRPGC